MNGITIFSNVKCVEIINFSFPSLVIFSRSDANWTRFLDLSFSKSRFKPSNLGFRVSVIIQLVFLQPCLVFKVK